MKKIANFTGAIGAWLTSELHPAGATYSSPNSNFSSIKLNGIYGTLDYLSIGWFGVDMSNPTNPTLSTSNAYLAQQVADARAQNPDMIIFALLAYTDQITADLQKIIADSILLSTFANNVASFLGNNGLNGFDIDWESPTNSLTSQQSGAWFNALGAAFGDTYYLAVSASSNQGQQSVDNLNADAVNANVDVFNLQSRWVSDPSVFIAHGINADLLGFGAYFESGVTALQAYQQYAAGIQYQGQSYPYQSMMSWRLDSSNWPFEQSQQLLIRQYMTGQPYVLEFDDGAILNVQTTPTLVQSIVIRSGDVVDAIQCTNVSSDGSYLVQLLQHGGDGGHENNPINFTNGLTAFSYVTGNWYGQQVIAQITINDINYPAAVSPSVSNQQMHQVTAPDGKTIIAFSGQTQYVNLAGGGFTWVLAQINPVFG
ncbi:glycosyl hydrolase family 18 protein [uncultured Shewanella sp.]|uniref:glycosyl hydrolase family 18 protein n=1 Tax=uncultured Shewanella sp. TaxID=173975 RepID=UPI00262735B8|nr:glycosyl hydrolase family 18 protein [uncultured Shewanella sp.]